MTSVVAPLDGVIIDITEVPDPVFSQKTMGDGFGITSPPSGDILAPVSGTVIVVAKTKHAVGIKTEDGLQFLVHLGIDTVELGGAPFDITVQKGDTVTAGDRIGSINVAAIEQAGKSATTIVVITNSKKKLDRLEVTTGPAKAGSTIAEATAVVAGASANVEKRPEAEVAPS